MTKNGITTLTLLIEADECDTAAVWRPSAIVTAMQRATHYAREALGIDWSSLAAKGALWVVSRVNVSFERIPKMGEKLTLRAIPQKRCTRGALSFPTARGDRSARGRPCGT